VEDRWTNNPQRRIAPRAEGFHDSPVCTIGLCWGLLFVGADYERNWREAWEGDVDTALVGITDSEEVDSR
jgi:hypothetical protein